MPAKREAKRALALIRKIAIAKREAKRALALIRKIARVNKREAELLASIPTDVAVDNATVKKIVTYSSLLKRESAFLAELKTILEKM